MTRATTSVPRLVLVAALAGLMAAPALGATPPKPAPKVGQALEISPAVQTLNVNAGKAQTINVTIRNISKEPQVVTPRVDDFEPDGETGLPKLLLDGGDPSRSIKGWLKLSAAMTIAPGKITPLSIVVTPPANASPGTHYGALRFTAAPPGVDGTGVSISTSIGSLLLMNVAGATSEKLTTVEFTAAKNGRTGSVFEKAPIDFMERLRNEGNVSLTPAGTIQITDTFGKKIADVNVNLPPRLVLPGSIRKFDETLNGDQLGDKFLFGHYKARLNLTYGDSKKVLTSTIGFWVIPYTIIAIVLGVIILLVVLFLILKRYVNFEVKTKKSTRRRR